MNARIKLRWFLVAVAIQILILLGLAARHQYTVWAGTPVLLKTEAVDPWDLFRGDYVRLNYAISELPLPAGEKIGYRDPVWVVLKPPGAGGKYWEAVAVSATKPSVGPGQVAVKARALYAFDRTVRLQYGFEQFFVPEGRGLELERNYHRLDVEVAVDRFGRAVLKTVFWDSKPIRWDR